MDKNHYIDIEGRLYVLSDDAYIEWIKTSAELGDMAEFPRSVIKVPHYRYHRLFEGYDDFDADLEHIEDLKEIE